MKKTRKFAHGKLDKKLDQKVDFVSELVAWDDEVNKYKKGKSIIFTRDSDPKGKSV